MQAFEIVARRWHAANRERTEPSRRSSPALRRKGAFRFSTCQSSWFAASWFAARAVARASAHARTKITCTARHPCAWHCAPIRYVTKDQGQVGARQSRRHAAQKRGGATINARRAVFFTGVISDDSTSLCFCRLTFGFFYVWRRACVGPSPLGRGFSPLCAAQTPKQTEPKGSDPTSRHQYFARHSGSSAHAMQR